MTISKIFNKKNRQLWKQYAIKIKSTERYINVNFNSHVISKHMNADLGFKRIDNKIMVIENILNCG